jgi:NADH:ubiquinone oxidoreductase subunit F (NADH-binding)
MSRDPFPRVASPVRVPTDVEISVGPALLAGIHEGPGLAAHRARYGEPAPVDLDTLVDVTASVRLRGRGGAAFPFATKLEAAARGRRPIVVVNLSEGEPASAKDSALALTRPHLILDGAASAAAALGARELHVVVPGERPLVAESMRRALDERRDRLTVRLHVAEPRFVAGQARAVIELMSGRPNLPVTAWAPEAVHGHRGRPTLLSNAETWAQIGRLVLVGEAGYRRTGRPGEPGTTLLTLASTGSVPHVLEVEYGARLRDVLPADRHGRPVLVGGFHGSWATWQTVASASVSVDRLRALGVPLGAGVLLSPHEHQCPVGLTSAIVDHLAGQSAGQCGPCFNGLPALADAVRAIRDGAGGTNRVDQLTALVTRRGACAHPDGTARLVRSLLAAFPAEIAAHAAGRSELCDSRAAS